MNVAVRLFGDSTEIHDLPKRAGISCVGGEAESWRKKTLVTVNQTPSLLCRKQ